MNVRQIFQGKDRFLDLLLLGDEQEDMIARYLGRGELFALYDPNLRGVCVVTDEGAGTFELKNLAVPPKYQRRATAGRWWISAWPAALGVGTLCWWAPGTVPSPCPFTWPAALRPPTGWKISFLTTMTTPFLRAGSSCGTWCISGTRCTRCNRTSLSDGKKPAAGLPAAGFLHVYSWS